MRADPVGVPDELWSLRRQLLEAVSLDQEDWLAMAALNDVEEAITDASPLGPNGLATPVWAWLSEL